MIGAFAASACAPRGTERRPAAPVVSSEELHGRLDLTDRQARIALSGGVVRALVSATTPWRIDEQGGRQSLVRGAGGEGWRVEQRSGLLRVAGEGDDATPWRTGPFVARPTASGFLTYNGKRYRGELWFSATDSGVQVVNRLPVEDYLRGVVPLELGTRQPADRPALEAQVIAARSYAYVRVPAEGAPQPASGWHMVATVNNQVYGGVEVEHPLVNQAIDATAGLVLRYAGRTVDAPYYSACGGRTATPRDAWRDAREEPYLQSVDDIDLSTGRPYCDINPRNHWVEELGEQQLSEAVRRAIELQGSQQPQATGVRELQVAERSASGRVAVLQFRTDRGDITVRARDVRAVLRDARGANLSSTYFSVEREARNGGRLTGVTLRGNGNGHGVGLCQWGAIGRARAGQSARMILQHYYPGTVVGFAD
ncbi:MAG: SpoIID/LytB domain-containing protein [Gemmatimonadaceae bacterium]|nr:SpoIID/LytB domain-containing protein [Gemmatimonadaceae bacterium]